MRKRLIVLLLAAVQGGLLTRASAADPTDAPPATPARIAKWVSQLDADTFVARETATEQLIQAGGAVIGPLVGSLDGSNLEVTTRGIYVLRELALSSDVEVQTAAQTALERIASARATSAARLASNTLTQLGAIRQDRAIQELRDLGAEIARSHRQLGFQVAEVMEVEVGEGWRGEDKDLARLRWLVDAQELRLIGRRVKDDWLRHVAHMKNLNGLIFNRTSITADGLAHLRSLEKVQQLEIKYSPVGDEATRHLRWETLQVVKLYGTNISKPAALQLQQALANAEVDHRNGAFLGVACEQPPQPCAVMRVQPNTAASRGGLQEGDVIIRYNDHPVDDFNALKEQIGQSSAGDTATLQVLRGGDPSRHVLRHRDGDRLGVQGKPHSLGFEITEVQDESVARRLGLRKGDVIMRYDSQAVPDTKTLDALYSKRQVGQESQLGVIRNAQIVTRKVTFGEWE